jgi:hypothetical protein
MDQQLHNPGEILMTDLKLPNPAARSHAGSIVHAIGHHLGSRGGLLVLGLAIIVLGIALNWSWLLALGIAPLLLSALPCLAMCALGLCMHKMADRSGNSPEQTPKGSTKPS